MNTQLHLIIKAEKGKVLKTDAKKITRNWRYELFGGVVSIPVISVEKARALLAEIRTKKYAKAYRYEISKQIFSDIVAYEKVVLVGGGAL